MGAMAVDGRGRTVLGASLFGRAVLAGPCQMPNMDHDPKEDEARHDLGEDVLDEKVASVQDVMEKMDTDSPNEADEAAEASDRSGNEDTICSIGMLIPCQAGPFSDGTEHLDPDDKVEQTKEEGKSAMKADANVSGVMGVRVFEDPSEVDNVEVGLLVLAAVGAVVDGLVGFSRGTRYKPDVEEGLADDVDGCQGDEEPFGNLFDPVGKVGAHVEAVEEHHEGEVEEKVS